MNFMQKLTTIATVTTIATLTAGTAQAAKLTASDFDNGQLGFAQDTTVYFDFFESHGMAKSNLDLYEITEDGKRSFVTTLFSEGGLGYDGWDGKGLGYMDEHDDWLGRAGVTVADPNTSFIFEGGKTYVFRLVGDVVPGAGWSSNAGWDLNPYAPDPYSDDQVLSAAAYGQYHLKVIDGPGSYTYNTMGPTTIGRRTNPNDWWNLAYPELSMYDPKFVIPQTEVAIEDGVVFLAWEDHRYGDGDFQDFMFTAYIDDSVAVPEPSTAGALLGIGVLGLFNLRRRKSRKNG